MPKAAPEIRLVEDEAKPSHKPIANASCPVEGSWRTKCVGDLRGALSDPRSLDKLGTLLLPGDRLSLIGYVDDIAANADLRSEIAEILVIRSRPGTSAGPARVAYEVRWYHDLTKPTRYDWRD